LSIVQLVPACLPHISRRLSQRARLPGLTPDTAADFMLLALSDSQMERRRRQKSSCPRKRSATASRNAKRSSVIAL